MSKELEDELILMGKNARKASQILTLAKSEISKGELDSAKILLVKAKEMLVELNKTLRSFNLLLVNFKNNKYY